VASASSAPTVPSRASRMQSHSPPSIASFGCTSSKRLNALRTQVGHILGQRSAFAHLEPSNFTPSFLAPYVDEETGETTSKHAEWIARVDDR